MATEILPGAIERSTYVVKVSCFDETTTVVIPNSAVWTLTDDTGGVVHSRSAVALTPSTEMSIVLNGADLPIADGGYGDRDLYLSIYATYNSTLGTSMPLRHEVRFQVKNLLHVTS